MVTTMARFSATARSFTNFIIAVAEAASRPEVGFMLGEGDTKGEKTTHIKRVSDTKREKTTHIERVSE